MTGTILPALAGGAIVGGLVLLIAGLRGWTPSRAARWRRARGRDRLGAAGTGPRAVISLRARLIAGVVLGLVVLAITRWVVLAISAGVAAVTVPVLLFGDQMTYHLRRVEALANWTRRLATLLAAGVGGLEQVIHLSTRTCPPPVADEVRRLDERLRGRLHDTETWGGTDGPTRALRAFADEINDPVADLIASCLIRQTRTGSYGLRDVLAALADSVDERARARASINAERSKTRTNARALIIVVLTMLFAVVALGRESLLEPYGTLIGQLALGLIAGLFAWCLYWIHRVSVPAVTGRFLPAERRPSRQARS